MIENEALIGEALRGEETVWVRVSERDAKEAYFAAKSPHPPRRRVCVCVCVCERERARERERERDRSFWLEDAFGFTGEAREKRGGA